MLSIGLERAHVFACLVNPRILEAINSPIVMMLVIGAIALIVFSIVKLPSWPTETQMARDRLSDIQEALKTQKQMIDLSLMYEAALVDQHTSFDATHRVEKLKQYREMLHPIGAE